MARKPKAPTNGKADFREELRLYEAVKKEAADTWAKSLQGQSTDTEERQRQKDARQRMKILARYEERGIPLPDDIGLEKSFGSIDFIDLDFLARGLCAARSVGKIMIGGKHMGTGFLIGPNMMMTNNHVIPTPAFAGPGSVICMHRYHDTISNPGGTPCRFDPEAFFWTNDVLDVTVVALADDPETRSLRDELGWHPMLDEQGKIIKGDGLTIVQYPENRPKTIVVHNSMLLELHDDGEHSDFCFYSSDTEYGSSGSPVFNKEWEIIALHARSVPEMDGDLYVTKDGDRLTHDEAQRHPHRIKWISNRGIRTSRIVKALHEEQFLEHPKFRGPRDMLFVNWRKCLDRNIGQEPLVKAVMAGLEAMHKKIDAVMSGRDGPDKESARSEAPARDAESAHERHTHVSKGHTFIINIGPQS